MRWKPRFDLSGMQDFNVPRLLLASLPVSGQFSVTPTAVLRLFVCLLHQMDEKILDHLLDLGERIVRDSEGEFREHAAVELTGPQSEEICRSLLKCALCTRVGKYFSACPATCPATASLDKTLKSDAFCAHVPVRSVR